MSTRLLNILHEYAFSVTGITKVQDDVYKIKTNQGYMCLKRADRRQHKVIFIYSVLKHLTDKGFTKVSPPVPTRTGEPMVVDHQDIYFVTKWVSGIPCDFTKTDHLKAAARTLAEFHLVAQGLDVLPGGKARAMYWKWPATFEQRVKGLEQFRELVCQKPAKTRFEKIFLGCVDHYIAQGKKAAVLLKVPAYSAVAAIAQRLGTYTHRDVAARNFIINWMGEAILIDFDYCRYDLPLADLVRMIERALRRDHWEITTAELILREYHKVRPISSEEYGIMWAFLQFPQKFWRLVDRYFFSKKDWEEEDYVKKLASINKGEAGRARFIELFRNEFCQHQ